MARKVRCWHYFACTETGCPAHRSPEIRCWLIPGTHCRNEIQGKFLEKIEMCLDCEPFKANIDLDSMEETLQSVNQQFQEFRKMVAERDRELEGISMELALGLSEVFYALKEISSGNPEVRIPEISDLELIQQLKHMVNLTAKNLGEIVDLSHEFAIGLAEHFDVLHRVSLGDRKARVLGASRVQLLESLRNVTNRMVESVSDEINERERVEEALRSSEAELREAEEKYHTLFDYDPNSIFVLEPGTFKILDMNARALEIYGYDKAELTGKCFTDLGKAEYSNGVLSEAASHGTTLCSVYPKIEHYRKNGVTFYVNVYACQRKRAGKYGIIATTVDITESLAREAQLIQASKMSTLGEMATGVAHELNQPLTTLQIGADFLQSMHRQGRKIPAALIGLIGEQMTGQVKRAVRIINHLREFGRKADTRTERVDVNKPLRGVFTLLSQQLKLRGIRVVLDLAEGLPPILGDSNRLEQVFVDMVINARDAMEEKKKAPDVPMENSLTVRSYGEAGRVVVTMTDTGVGIPAEIRQKIFEPFFTTKKAGEGTGLGLSISYGIIKDHEGVIAVESEVGKGATFKMTFPGCSEKEAKR